MKSILRLCGCGWVVLAFAVAGAYPVHASEHEQGKYVRVDAAGAVFQIHADGVAGIALDSPGGKSGTVQTVNGSRIRGVLSRPAGTLTGKRKVASPVADEADAAWEKPLYFIVLTSGDYLNGPITDGGLAIAHPGGADAGALTDMSRIALQAGSDASAGVTIDPDGSFNGTLCLDDIALVVEASPAIRVYDQRGGANEALATKSGKASEPMQLIHMDGNRMVGYCVNQSNGVRVRNVSSGMPADRGGMKVGDWVLTIDGEPVSKGYDIWTPRDAVTAGKQQHVLLETRRGVASRWYLIVK